MTGLANQLGVNAPIIETATQIFKLASQNNFIQGRRMDMVAAVCLYTACRKTRPCTVMLIDFADKVQVSLSIPAVFFTDVPGQCLQTWPHI